MEFKIFNQSNFHNIPQLQSQPKEILEHIKTVGNVLPFRVNNYVLDHLIDWSNIPDDPLYQLTFPQEKMLMPADYVKMKEALTDEAATKKVANEIRNTLNPHPADQLTKNIPQLDGQFLEGIQHKYTQTVLFFPAQGQTCHSYCTFCFRWPQFIGDKSLRFASKDAKTLINYLKQHKNVTDLLITGGDPLIMKTHHLAEYLEPLIDPECNHIQNIRIGSKALSYWPHRFTTDPDADELLHLFERLVKKGKHLAIMAHYNHGRELEPLEAQNAIHRIRNTGATIRSQGPLLAHINDNPLIWSNMWRSQVKLGIIPYYMFIERDTGANHYFKLSLEKCWHIYKEASSSVSGLCKTARGPSMSTSPGKIEIQGITEILGEKVFVLRFLQARNSEWNQRPFFAKYDSHASWLSNLKPAFGEEKFFFELN
jgi:KamA family protein